MPTFRQRCALCWSILTRREPRGYDPVPHARRELWATYPVHAEDGTVDAMNAVIRGAALETVTALAALGHSRGTADMAIPLASQLLNMEPLSPLTGAADEWWDVGPYEGKSMFQNKRCSSVFKDSEDGEPYDIEGFVWVHPDGVVTQDNTPRPVVFPYIPGHPTIVHVDERGVPFDDVLRDLLRTVRPE